jgi:hypothetical protein
MISPACLSKMTSTAEVGKDLELAPAPGNMMVVQDSFCQFLSVKKDA